MQLLSRIHISFFFFWPLSKKDYFPSVLNNVPHFLLSSHQKHLLMFVFYQLSVSYDNKCILLNEIDFVCCAFISS